ncbi:hypothetical protein ACFO0S_14415 [Chryseomicrobium palamuruense]|uniref:Uncharacterized protein n=1 Tax=Chryseomicrobium palamuruense TaxID=682973 RepID=A0ABV8V036_9BACL
MKKFFVLLVMGICLICFTQPNIGHAETVGTDSITVGDGGNAGAVSTSLEIGKASSSTSWIKIIDGSTNLYVKSYGGAIIASVYFVYASGPDMLIESFYINSGSTLNKNLNLVPGTYTLVLTASPYPYKNSSGYGYLTK